MLGGQLASVTIKSTSRRDDGAQIRRFLPMSDDVDESVLLSLWMVETSAGNGERRVVVQSGRPDC